MRRTVLILSGLAIMSASIVFAGPGKHGNAVEKLKQGEINADTLKEIEKTGKSAAKELRKLIKNKNIDKDIRVASIVLMGKIKSGEDRQDLEDILENDDNQFNREAAALALADLGSGEATPKLKKSLNDPSGNVRMRAALALGKLGDKSGKEAVLEAMSGDDVTAKFLAVEAIGSIGDKNMIAELKKNKDSSNAWTRIFSELAIKRLEIQGLNEKESLNYLKVTLQDNQFEVTKWAASELGKIGTPESIKILQETAKSNVSPGSGSAMRVLAIMEE